MSTAEASLEEWSKQVDPSLPKECPGCNRKLEQVRYTHDKDTMTIHLTGAVNETEYYAARCPHCDYILKAQTVSRRMWR